MDVVRRGRERERRGEERRGRENEEVNGCTHSKKKVLLPPFQFAWINLDLPSEGHLGEWDQRGVWSRKVKGHILLVGIQDEEKGCPR